MKRLLGILICVCLLLGTACASAESLYSDVQVYDMYGTYGSYLGTESIAYVYSSECTKSALSDWYFNYCQYSGNQWNILIYMDQADGETVYGIVNCGDTIYVNAWVYNVQAGSNTFTMYDPTYADYCYIASDQTHRLRKATGMSLYVLNMDSARFHLPGCTLISRMKAENTWFYTGNYYDVTAMGYAPCTRCNPY